MVDAGRDIDDQIVRKYYKPEEYFGTTTETIFEVNLLNLISSMLFHCTAEFHNIAYTLNETMFNEGTKIEYHLIEDIFFTFQIAKILPEFPMTVKRQSRRLNVEHFCAQAIPFIRKIASDNYIAHKCKEDKGCELRLVVADGNEKAHRRICQAPKEHVQGNIGRDVTHIEFQYFLVSSEKGKSNIIIIM